jgi:hypothetical protein
MYLLTIHTLKSIIKPFIHTVKGALVGLLRRGKEQITYDIQNQEKECCVCHVRQPFSSFYNFKNKNDGKSYRCKSCDDKAGESWRRNNPDSFWRSSRNRALKSKYGISLAEYTALKEEQGNCCAICGSMSPRNMGDEKQSFSVDHNHETGKIRGLLCNNCNRGLGLLGDTPEAIIRVLRYLENTH